MFFITAFRFALLSGRLLPRCRSSHAGNRSGKRTGGHCVLLYGGMKCRFPVRSAFRTALTSLSLSARRYSVRQTDRRSVCFISWREKQGFLVRSAFQDLSALLCTRCVTQFADEQLVRQTDRQSLFMSTYLRFMIARLVKLCSVNGFAAVATDRRHSGSHASIHYAGYTFTLIFKVRNMYINRFHL